MGGYFGEVALITNLKRTASVKAVDYCTLSSINRTAFHKARDEFPTIF